MKIRVYFYTVDGGDGEAYPSEPFKTYAECKTAAEVEFAEYGQGFTEVYHVDLVVEDYEVIPGV